MGDARRAVRWGAKRTKEGLKNTADRPHLLTDEARGTDMTIETKTYSKCPLTIEEMRDVRFLIDVMKKNLSHATQSTLGLDIEWALYTLDHAIECQIAA